MTYQENYAQWLDSEIVDADAKAELQAIENDPAQIEDRFYRELAFGTGGMRGVIGAGLNRMNKYTVGRSTQGLAEHVLAQGGDAAARGVVIAHDSRHMSDAFAREAACVLAANGVKAHLYEQLEPTPVLSYSVRRLGAMAGIVITASHNPPAYNGYKVYWEDGGQIVPELADALIARIDGIPVLGGVRTMDENEARQKGLIVSVPDEVLESYYDKVVDLCIRPDICKTIGKELKLIYTPLHGAGNIPVRTVLDRAGFTQVNVVPEQEKPDGDFPTVKYPNPEDPAAFALAIELAKKENAPLIIATDPDSDRVGVVARDRDGEYHVLTGNQTGVLLADYVLGGLKHTGKLPGNAVMIKTIVTSELGAVIARHYGVTVADTLTGFKFICELIKGYEQTGEKSFVFGYEESYGYLAGLFVRDKDAVIASLLICEMAAWYHSRGMGLVDALQAIWKKHGYYNEIQRAIQRPGASGMEEMAEIMAYLRLNPIKEVAGMPVARVEDYQRSIVTNPDGAQIDTISLYKSNVLRYTMGDGSWIAVRPSGTEPKIKIYFSCVAQDEQSAARRCQLMADEMMAHIDKGRKE